MSICVLCYFGKKKILTVLWFCGSRWHDFLVLSLFCFPILRWQKSSLFYRIECYFLSVISVEQQTNEEKKIQEKTFAFSSLIIQDFGFVIALLDVHFSMFVVFFISLSICLHSSSMCFCWAYFKQTNEQGIVLSLVCILHILFNPFDCTILWFLCFLSINSNAKISDNNMLCALI